MPILTLISDLAMLLFKGMHVSKHKFGISFGEKFITLIFTKWKKGRSVAYSSTRPLPLSPGPSTIALELPWTRQGA